MMKNNTQKIHGIESDLKGKEGEQIAYELANVPFLKEWCFKNPQKKRNNKEQELCDLLIIYDDTLFIWQIKNVKLDNGYYKDKHKIKNMDQLIGAYKSIFLLKDEITLPNYGKLNPDDFKNIFLCSVFMGEPENNSRFLQEFNGKTIHTMHKDTLNIIVNELDTVSDFIRYYKLKESIGPIASINVLGGEEELLAYYLKNNREIPLNEAEILILENIWESLKVSKQFINKQKANEISILWDNIIEIIQEESKLQAIDIKELIIELLRPTRYFRRVLSKSILELMLKANKESAEPIKRYLFIEEIQTVYCLMYIDATEGFNHQDAQNNLSIGCGVAKYLYPNAKYSMGIAVLDDYINSLYSFISICFDGEGLTQDEYEYYISMAGRSFQQTKFTEHEYPD